MLISIAKQDHRCRRVLHRIERLAMAQRQSPALKLGVIAATAAAAVAVAVLIRRRRRRVRDDQLVTILDHEPIMGQDKYLGGSLGSDGCIYGIPGHAKQVIKIDPTTQKVSLIGGPFPGKYKWLRR